MGADDPLGAEDPLGPATVGTADPVVALVASVAEAHGAEDPFLAGPAGAAAAVGALSPLSRPTREDVALGCWPPAVAPTVC